MRTRTPARLSLVGVLVLTACQSPVPTDEIPLQEVTVHELPSDDTPTAIAPGKTHSRELELFSGEFVRVLVDQRSVDVAVRLVGPGGEEAASVDSPNGKNGFEELLTWVETPGRYRVEVVSLSDEPGEYVLADLVHRPATAEDREAVTAERLYWEGRDSYQEQSWDDAIARYRRALETWERLGHARRRIETLHGLCRVYLSLGEYPAATSLCEKAVGLYRDHDDQRGLDVVLKRAAWLRLARGQPERAVPYLEEAVALYEARGRARGAALGLSNLGTAYHQMDRPQLAREAFERALEWNEKLDEPETEAAIRSDLGDMLLDLRRLSEAFEQYTRALELQRQVGKPSAIALALEGVAFTAAQLGDGDTAETAVREAIRLAGDGRRPSFDATLGLVLQLRGDYDGARRSYEEALHQAQASGSRQHEGTILVRLGLLDMASEKPAQALVLFDQSLAIFVESGMPRGEAFARVYGGCALAELGRTEEAWRRIEPALGLIEGLRGRLDRREVRTGYFAFRQDYYEIAIDVLMRSSRVAEAFAVNERRLVRELHETITRRRLSSRSDVDPALLGEEERIEALLAEAARLPRSDPEREKRVGDLVRQLDDVTARIRRALLDETPSVVPEVDVETLRDGLDDGTLLLAYALGEERSYLWSLSRDALEADELPRRAEIEERAAAFATALAGSSKRHRDAAERIGHELAAEVFGSFAGRLAGYPRIVLVLEGGLQAVPFAALPGPQGTFLTQSHEIVAVPSVSALLAQRRNRPAVARPPSILIFADPVFRADDPRLGDTLSTPAPRRASDGDLQQAAQHLGADPWRRLPDTRSEAARIQALYAGETMAVFDFEASRETLTSLDLRKHSVLHFATHALLADRPELSGLVLSLLDEQGRGVNGFVRAFEISRLELSAELVVLSACETGLGKDLRGEGMQGLARAFLDAGATRVVYSLWKVGDRSTAELMERFYEGLTRHGHPAAALREAQLHMMKEPKTAAPHQWAGFVLLGDWRGLASQGGTR